MAGAGFVDDIVHAIVLVAEASGAEPEEVLEALPYVKQRVEDIFQKENPGHLTITTE